MAEKYCDVILRAYRTAPVWTHKSTRQYNLCLSISGTLHCISFCFVFLNQIFSRQDYSVSMYLRHSHKAISHLPLVQNFASETTPYHSYTFYPWYKIGFELLNILKALHGLPLPALCPMSQAPACAPPENPSCLPPQSPYILGVSQGVSKFSKTTPYCPTESRGSRVPSLLKFQSTASIIITVTAKLKKVISQGSMRKCAKYRILNSN